jgi:hypothetical protein
MERALSALVVLAVSAGPAFSAGTTATKAAAKAPAYSLTGRYYETCACAVSCPCASNATLPTEGHCDAISLVHVEKGMVGTTKLDGINIAAVLRTPHGQKTLDSFNKGEMDLITIYLDEAATNEQKDALNKVVPVLFQGMDKMKGFHAPQWAPMSLKVEGDIARYEIAGGQKLSFEIEHVKVSGVTKEGVKRSPTSDRIELSNTAPFPWVHTVTQGISKKFHYDDLGAKWDYEGRNAFFGTVAAKGSLPASAPAAK